MKSYFFVIFLIFTFLYTQAQQDDIVEVYGKILDQKTSKPVAFAFVVNYKKSIGTKTDTSGKFRILMSKDDTLRISCLGYQTTYVPFPKNTKIIDGKIKTNFYIKEISYQIGKVDIYAERWRAFVNEISNTRVEKDPLQENLVVWVDKVLEDEDLKTISRLSRGQGVLIPLPLKSKKERELKRLRKLQQKEQIQKQIEEKFNRELIHEITGLEGEELDNFIKNYCNFDKEFILKTSKYDLIVIIQDIYEEYEKNKKNQTNQKN